MTGKLIQAYRQAYGGVPRNVWLISLALLVNRAGAMVLPFLSLYFTEQLGFSKSSVGFLLGIYGLGSIVGGLLGGSLTQRLGALRTQLGSLALTVPAFLALAQVESWLGAAGSLFFLSVVAEAIRPASVTATVEFCEGPHQHPKAMAVNRLAVNLGMSVGPAVGGFLASRDFSLLFYVNAASCLASLVCLIAFFGSGRGAPHSVAGEGATARDTISPWRDMPFLAFLGLTLLAAIVFFQLLGTFPLYLTEFYRLREYHIGLLMSVNTVVIVLFELVLVSFVDRHKLLQNVAWGYLLSCVGFGILPLAVGASFPLGLGYCAMTVLVWTWGEMLSMPLASAYVARRSNESNRGKYMGAYVTSYSVAFVLAPVAGMALYRISPHGLWYACLVLGIIVFWGTRRLAQQAAMERPAGGTGARS